MDKLLLAAKVFADPTRVRVINALRGQELCVCELCDALETRQSTLSTHLQVIRDAGLVTARKEGKWMYYAIDPAAEKLIRPLFAFFAASLAGDKTLQSDEAKLARRLLLRDSGACCVGFNGSKRKCA